MKKVIFSFCFFFVLSSNWAYGRDFGLLVEPVHTGRFTTSVLFENLKLKDDFDTRGRVDFKSKMAGTQVTYGVSDLIGVSIKGAALIDPKTETQGSEWRGHGGFVYGIDMFNEVFPATDVRPGVILNLGISGFQVPLERIVTNGTTSPIDQKLSGHEYHGAVLSVTRFGRSTPYAGVRAFRSTVHWRNNQPTVGAPDNITGHGRGNMSLVVGWPVQLRQDWRLSFEGQFLNGTTLTAGFTIAVF